MRRMSSGLRQLPRLTAAEPEPDVVPSLPGAPRVKASLVRSSTRSIRRGTSAYIHNIKFSAASEVSKAAAGRLNFESLQFKDGSCIVDPRTSKFVTWYAQPALDLTTSGRSPQVCC